MNFYESPVFIDILLIGIYVLLLCTLALTVWSMLHTARLHDRQPKEQGIAAGRIAWSVFVLLVLTLGATCLLADTHPLLINGNEYNNKLWLRVSDMLINSSTVLIVVAILCAIAGMWGLGRRLNK